MRAVYMRQIQGACWLGEEPVELEFTATQSGDDVSINFTDETKLHLYSLRLTPDEIVGCDEAATDAYWAHEWEQIRLASVRQRNGERAA